MDEVRIAVEKGYEVIDVYEVYQYEVTQYDPATGEGGLYVEYLNKFLKMKAEASGYPSWVRSPDDEDQYVREFRDSEASSWTRVRFVPTRRDAASGNSV
jgi:hypothetical protein